MSETPTQCPPDAIASLVDAIQRNDGDGQAQLEDLLSRYPIDERLHFLLGSILAGSGRYDEARMAMRKAIEISPPYEIARYQLGFLEYTSGDLAAAKTVWEPLLKLGEDAPLQLFVEGLLLLAGDMVDEARGRLERGIAMNTTQPVINRDIGLILHRLKSSLQDLEDTTTSSTELLLRQSAFRPTRH